MSNAVSALTGKVSPGKVAVRDMGLRGMIVLRGDLSSKALKAVCTKLTGVQFPTQGQANVDADKGLCWMSPEEVLVLLPYAETAEAIAKINKALAGKHYLAENVSDARAVIEVQGPFAREVIAKLAPVDLHPDSFVPGDFRRTRLAQAAAAFWMPREDTFEVICFRSVAVYVFDLLDTAAKAGKVGHY